jgi:hypothetical protein
MASNQGKFSIDRQQGLKGVEIIHHLIAIEEQQKRILDELLLIKYATRYSHQPLAEVPNPAAQAYPILRGMLQSALQEAFVKKKSSCYFINEKKNTKVLLVPSWKDILRAEAKKFLKR